MLETTSLRPDEIQIGDRLRRSLDRDSVDRLKESIAKIGLKTPVSVQLVSDEEGWFLVAGRHRLQACIELGWAEIPVCEETGTALEARMWEIAENLHRAELTVMERSEHVSAWITLSGERDNKLSQTTTVSSRGRLEGRGNEGGIRAAARELGIDKDAAHRAVKIASLPDSAKEAAREVGLDNSPSAMLAAGKAADPAAEIRRIAAEKVANAEKAAAERVAKAARATIEKAAETMAFGASDTPRNEGDANAPVAPVAQPEQQTPPHADAAAARASDKHIDKLLRDTDSLSLGDAEVFAKLFNERMVERRKAAL